MSTAAPPSAPHRPVDGPPRLRVVRVYFHLEVGGIEARLLDLLPRLDRRRFDVEMVCTRRPGRLAPEMTARGIPVRVCRYRSKLPLFVSLVPLARLFARLGPDIVHAHGETPSHVATLAARRAGVPIVIGNFHTSRLFREGPRQLERERRSAPMRDLSLHVSESVRAAWLEALRPLSPPSAVLYNGVDVERFATPPPPGRLDELRRELGIGDAGPVLLHVARFHRDKGHADLLDALARVRARHPRATLVLVGDGRRRDEVVAAASRPELEGAVCFAGHRSEVSDLYHLADLNVVPSVREGFSNVVLEAMAAGLPQVLTRVGGNPEAVGDSGAALLVEPRRPDELAGAILALLGDEGAGRRMRAAARRRAESFSVAQQLHATEALYERLAREKGLVGGGA